MKPRRDHARIIHHHEIAGAKQRGQIPHTAIFQAIRAHQQHARSIARADGRLGDQVFRQDEIIIIQPQRRGLSQHAGAVARSRPGRNRAGLSGGPKLRQANPETAGPAPHKEETMARLPYADINHPDHQEAAAAIQASRKRIGHLHRMLLHAPPIAMGWISLFDAIRWHSTLSGKLRELVICRIAAINGAQYEWNAHAPIAIQEGATEAQMAALPDWESSSLFDATERAVLAYCDAMTRHVHVPDDIAKAVAALLPPRQVVELTATVAGYNCVSRVLEALHINGADPLPAS
jgi:alkylhydroperoxidase family enzyme